MKNHLFPPSKVTQKKSIDIQQWLSTAENLQKNGRLSAAKEIYAKILSIQPWHPVALHNLGIIALQTGNLLIGKRLIEKAIKIVPDSPIFINSLGSLFVKMGAYADAVATYSKALELDPNYADAYGNRAAALIKTQDFQKATSDLQHQIELHPENDSAYYNRAILQQLLKKPQEALSDYKLSLKINPNNPEANLNLAVLLLSLKRFNEGWGLYHWRLLQPHRENEVPNLKLPPWQEDDRDTNKVIVWADQGVGDQILFGSLLSEFNQKAPKLTVCIDPRLIKLFERSMPGIQFVTKDAKLFETDFQTQLPMMSIGSLFRNRDSDFFNGTYPFLKADKIQIQIIKKILKIENKVLCGISWRSSSTKYGEDKSLQLRDLLPVLEIPDITFVNLQYGDTQNECNEFESLTGVKILNLPSIDNFNDLDGHAALIEACDFIVMGSNSTAHLAGALGKETYLAHSAGPGALWYWANESAGRCMWYPSVRVFNQSHINQWSDPILRIRDAVLSKLRDLIGRR